MSLLSNPEFEFYVWILSWAGTGCSETTATYLRIGWKNRLQTWLAQSSPLSTAGSNCLQNTGKREEREGQSVLINTLVFYLDMRMRLQISKPIWAEKVWVLTFLCLKICIFIPCYRYDALWNRKDKCFTDIFCIEIISIRFHWENFCT